MSTTVLLIRWHHGTWTCDKTANSHFLSFQRPCKFSGIRLSHPKFSFHRLCKIFLVCRTTGQRNPMGSYSQLTADRIPCLVGGWWGSWTLNKKASFSKSHCTSSVLSTGRFSRSKSTVGFAWFASSILDSTSWLLLIHFVSLNQASLSKQVTSPASDLASDTLLTDFTQSSMYKSLSTALTTSSLNLPLRSSAALFRQNFAQLGESVAPMIWLVVWNSEGLSRSLSSHQRNLTVSESFWGYFDLVKHALYVSY